MVILKALPYRHTFRLADEVMAVQPIQKLPFFPGFPKTEVQKGSVLLPEFFPGHPGSTSTPFCTLPHPLSRKTRFFSRRCEADEGPEQPAQEGRKKCHPSTFFLRFGYQVSNGLSNSHRQGYRDVGNGWVTL